MFSGEVLQVESFVVDRQLSSKRVRLVATVNGVPCFVKTFGDPVVQCAVDELKRLVGLPAIGVSRATVPPYGPVLICQYHAHECHLGEKPPTAAIAAQTLPALVFDVVIANNDRTDTNFLLLADGSLLPIDESAAFKKPATCRMRKWTPAVVAAAATYDPHGHCQALEATPAVADVLRRCGLPAWATTALAVSDRARDRGALWGRFLDTARR